MLFGEDTYLVYKNQFTLRYCVYNLNIFYKLLISINYKAFRYTLLFINVFKKNSMEHMIDTKIRSLYLMTMFKYTFSHLTTGYVCCVKSFGADIR